METFSGYILSCGNVYLDNLFNENELTLDVTVYWKEKTPNTISVTALSAISFFYNFFQNNIFRFFESLMLVLFVSCSGVIFTSFETDSLLFFSKGNVLFTGWGPLIPDEINVLRVKEKCGYFNH